MKPLCFAGALLWLCSSVLLDGVNADVEIAPWHLKEDPDGRPQRPKIIRVDGGHHQQRPRQFDGPFLYHPSETGGGHARKRREPRPNSSLYYWYHSLFHHTNSNAELGPERPKRTSNAEPPSFDSYTVAVYYYPWYHTDFHGRKYIRGELDPPMLPVLGEYDDRNASVIRQHLEWSRRANVNLWVTSWWGPDSGTDITTRDYILTNPHLNDHKFCLFYETMGRVRIDEDTFDTSNVFDDIAYAARTYFGHPNYFRIDDRPVLFVYLTRVLERVNLLREVISLMRTAAFQETGHQLYIVGDHTYGSPPDGPLDSFYWLDAVTNFDVFGSLGRPNGHATMKAVGEYSAEQAEWRKAAHAQGCAYIPGATPGYNDKAVRQGEYSAMSRKLDKGEPYGTLFRSLLSSGKMLVDESTGNLIIVNSFNEWHEDTQIEPVMSGGMTFRPWNLTRGYVYQGYGETYLDILAQETATFAAPQ